MSDRESSHAAVPDSGIGAVLVSARSLAEYRAMFALSDSALRRRLLDCPGGATSLTAEVNAAGGDATACDPIYARTSVDEFAAQAQADTDRGNRYVRTHPEQYRWGFFADPADHTAIATPRSPAAPLIGEPTPSVMCPASYPTCPSPTTRSS